MAIVPDKQIQLQVSCTFDFSYVHLYIQDRDRRRENFLWITENLSVNPVVSFEEGRQEVASRTYFLCVFNCVYRVCRQNSEAQTLHSGGYGLVREEEDGNCLLRGFGRQKYGDANEHPRVRGELVSSMVSIHVACVSVCTGVCAGVCECA